MNGSHVMNATTTIPPLADYVPELLRSDDRFRLRLLLHGFGFVWQHATQTERTRLVAAEPDRVDDRWDAFLAAYVEHLCDQDGLEPPGWIRCPTRRLRRYWFAGGCVPSDTDRTKRTTPRAFKNHGIYLPLSELRVV